MLFNALRVNCELEYCMTGGCGVGWWKMEMEMQAGITAIVIFNLLL